MTPDLLPRARSLARLGERPMARELGITRHRARTLLNQIALESRGPVTTTGNAISLYDTACRALAEAVQVDELKTVLDVSAAIRAYARQAKNRELEANAAILRERAERKLGEKLIEAKAAGQISRGQPPKNCSNAEQFSRVTLDEVDIDRKLSMRAQRKAGIAARAFDAMVDRMRDDIVSGRRSNDILKVVTTEQKQERREQREAELAGKILALPDKRYGVILADPEWRFEPYSRETGMDRAPENHYPTSTIETIAARPVADIAADDCVLALWGTQPMLPAQLWVMERWGFSYKSQIIWVKDRFGPGYWFREQHELLLIGTRGKVPCPAMGEQWPSIKVSPRLAHSQKPDWQYELIEAYFPHLPKIELNARRSRPGWDSWGLDAPAEAAE
jgi:N6-adenosine-specific RNA methylase IME4